MFFFAKAYAEQRERRSWHKAADKRRAHRRKVEALGGGGNQKLKLKYSFLIVQGNN